MEYTFLIDRTIEDDLLRDLLWVLEQLMNKLCWQHAK